jgi:hypothetical protein
MTVRLRDTNRKELRTPRMDEHGAPKFLLMSCGALLRLDGRGAHPYTSRARAGPSHEKSKKRVDGAFTFKKVPKARLAAEKKAALPFDSVEDDEGPF